MITRVQKWGNSQGLRFSREILKQASLAVGEEVDVSVNRGEIIVRPALQTRKKYRLEDLLEAMPEHYPFSETDWGKPSGKEVW